jgi:hypothetical protein
MRCGGGGGGGGVKGKNDCSKVNNPPYSRTCFEDKKMKSNFFRTEEKKTKFMGNSCLEYYTRVISRFPHLSEFSVVVVVVVVVMLLLQKIF